MENMAKSYIHEIPEGYEARIEGDKVIIELRVSEDERIINAIIGILKNSNAIDINVSQEKMFAWLEKQKENAKSAISIPSDCASDVKCEDRWHKVADSLPDNPREVLCKDEAGNYFIGRYYTSEGWEISNYDDEDKPHHLNPPVSKWIDFPSEKQKEQKPQSVYVDCTEHPEWYGMPAKEQKPAEWSDADYEARNEIMTMLIHSGKTPLASWFSKAFPFERKQEWSEEDEKMRVNILNALTPQLVYSVGKGTYTGTSTYKYDDEIKWLKSLRSQPKPDWSDEDEIIRQKLIRFISSPNIEEFMLASDEQMFVSWLKSLRPQPNKEIYQAAKHDLAIRFMNYLDENRPEGKMGLSNGECEDIDNAFKENDWAKIIRYYEKYGRRD